MEKVRPIQVPSPRLLHFTRPDRRAKIYIRIARGVGLTSPSGNGAVMSRNNILYAIIGALAVTAVVLGYNLYQDRKEPKRLHINLDDKGLSIQKK
jgi:hypothetical protein